MQTVPVHVAPRALVPCRGTKHCRRPPLTAALVEVGFTGHYCESLMRACAAVTAAVNSSSLAALCCTEGNRTAANSSAAPFSTVARACVDSAPAVVAADAAST